MKPEGKYSVPTPCETKNYKRPSGTGDTLMCNNIVLMYPKIQQYLVSASLRECKESHTGFLCCCSSPSSASTKGIIKYLASGTSIRCYNSGVRSCIVSISNLFRNLACTSCKDACFIVYVFGNEIDICEECYNKLTNMCLEHSYKTPHCVTLHYNKESSITMSMCTGTAMRLTNSENGRWIDSMSIKMVV